MLSHSVLLNSQGLGYRLRGLGKISKYEIKQGVSFFFSQIMVQMMVH